jgi:hypothetical protein
MRKALKREWGLAKMKNDSLHYAIRRALAASKGDRVSSHLAGYARGGRAKATFGSPAINLAMAHYAKRPSKLGMPLYKT